MVIMDIYNRPPGFNVEIFGCANEYKEKIKCTGILIPYKAEFDRRGEAYILYTKCPKCKAKYKFSLRWNEKTRWMKSLKHVYLNCFHCGSENVDVVDIKGKNTNMIKIRCNSCGKSFSKKYKKILIDQLEHDDEIDVESEINNNDEALEEGDDQVDDEEDESDVEIKIIDDFTGGETKHPIPVICPACQYEIRENFKGYCPGCGNRFSID